MRALLLLSLLVIACSKPTPEADREAGAVATRPRPPPARAFARFYKGQLTQCIDVIGDASTDQLEKALGDEQPIGKPCVNAFADRITLALCTVDLETDAGTTKLTVAHYDFADVGLSDVSMSECLAQGGSWNPLSRESALFRKAKLDYDRRKLHGLAEKLGAASTE